MVYNKKTAAYKAPEDIVRFVLGARDVVLVHLRMLCFVAGVGHDPTTSGL